MNGFGFWFILWAAQAGERASEQTSTTPGALGQAVLLVMLWGAACFSLVCAVLAQRGRRDR